MNSATLLKLSQNKRCYYEVNTTEKVTTLIDLFHGQTVFRAVVAVATTSSQAH